MDSECSRRQGGIVDSDPVVARGLYRPLGFGEIEGEFAGSKHDDVRLNILQLRARFWWLNDAPMASRYG